MANVQQASEELFKAIDLLTSKQINSLKFDKTLICTIESIEDKKNGAYRVSNGSSLFLAYASNANYVKGQKVHVQIPNGDMSAQKIITGRYVSEDDEYVSYVSPLNSFIDVSDNLIKENLEYSLKANKNTDKSIVIFESIGNSYIGYEKLGLSGNFKTLLGSKITKGSYGLRIDIIERAETGIDKYHSFYLDSQDMYGNPYNFSTFFKQEQAFNISYIKEITGIRLTFYQNSDFYYEDGVYVGLNDEDYFLTSNNIILQEPYIALGYDLSKFGQDTVLLGTHDDLTYSNLSSPQQRSMYMRWIHKEGDKFYSIDELKEIPENAVIHWYQYKIEQNRYDKLAGYFWKEINFKSDEDIFNYSFIPDYNVSEEGYKVIIEYPSRKFISDELQKDLNNNGSELNGYLNDIETSGIANLKEIQEAILSMCIEDNIQDIYKYTKDVYLQENETALKAFEGIYSIILSKKSSINYYTSEPLYFTNSITQEQEAIDFVQGLNIVVDEGNYKGIYRLYDETYNIINTIEASKMRTLKAVYNSVITGETSLDSAETITWYIPIDNTMIHEPTLGKEYNIDPEDEENSDIYLGAAACEEAGYPGYVGIQRKGAEIMNQLEDGVQLIEIKQQFRIKDYYTQTASNNTIFCEVKKRGKIYRAQTTLLFGTSGANGTEATFLLKMYEDNNGEVGDSVSALTAGGSVLVVPELYDYNNIPVNLTGKRITYSWYQKNTSDKITMRSPESSVDPLIITSHSKNISENEFYILKAIIPWANEDTSPRTIHLTAFLPIAIRSSNEYINIEGATKVVYNMNGVNPSYYKDPYALYSKGGIKITSIFWQGNSPEFTDSQAKKYYPYITSDGEFTPTNMYYTGLSPYCVEAKIGEQIVWSQPILIIQNKYASAMLNNWGGDLTIDEKNGTILSAMVGAGIKNSNNTFSGVLMGNMGEVADTNNHSGLGIYGFNDGEQSFGFNVKGTAFIGKSGKGRINFDGNKGTITSSEYIEENKSGLQLDFTAGTLDVKKENYGRMSVNLENKIFNISTFKGGNSKFLISFGGNTGDFIQSANYINDSTNNQYAGTFLNLTDGVFRSFQGSNHILIEKNSVSIASNNVKLSGGNSALILGNKGLNISIGNIENPNFVLTESGMAINYNNSKLSLTQDKGLNINVGGNGKFSLDETKLELIYNNSKLALNKDGILLNVNKGVHFNLSENNLIVSSIDPEKYSPYSVFSGMYFNLSNGIFDWRIGEAGIQAFLNNNSKLLTIGGKKDGKFVGFTLDRNGNASFSGSLEAATGTFAGILSAAEGSFSGEITAKSGTVGGWYITDYGLFTFIPDYLTLSKLSGAEKINYFTDNDFNYTKPKDPLEETNALDRKYIYYSPSEDTNNDEVKKYLKKGILIKGTCLIRQPYVENRSRLRYATGTFIVLEEKNSADKSKIYFLSNVKRRAQLRQSFSANENINTIKTDPKYAWPEGTEYREFNYTIINSDGELKAKRVIQDPSAE